MGGRLDWDRTNRELRARKYGTTSVYADLSPSGVKTTKKKRRKTKRKKQAQDKPTRLLQQLGMSLALVGAKKWPTKGAQYQINVVEQIRHIADKLVRLRPDLKDNAKVRQAYAQHTDAP